ncbi:hypothetical protein PCANB_000173 [Pneumocystis canis]|nr:hypothetical protein PCANB_000173 [Pneumocystis canis]
MAETVIFKNTPLDIGQGDETKNKIKTIFQSYYTFQQKQRSKKQNKKYSEMMFFYDKSQILCMKMTSLISTFLRTYFSEKEKSKFLERFRYIICTSQLLSENISPSLYHSQSSSLNCKKKNNSLLNTIIYHIRHWIVSSGCIVVLAFGINWCFKKDVQEINKKIRVYFKNIQKQAIFFMKRFVDTSQCFDITVNKTLALIQEVELVSRGYLLSLPLPPITRIETDSQNRRCKMLRLLLSTLLSQMLSSYNHSFSLLRTLHSKREFDTLQIMYNLPHSKDFDFLPSYFKEEDSDGLPYLKALFYTIHEKRRQCLVSLLSMSLSSLENVSSWRAIINQLRNLSDLMNNFHNEIETALENNERMLELSVPKAKMHEKNIKWNNHIRNINILLQVLRKFQAKLYILKEENTRLIQDNFDINTKNELLRYYDSLEDDLKVLMEKWEFGRNYLMKIPTKSEISTSNNMYSNLQSSENLDYSVDNVHESDSSQSIDEIKDTKALSEITNDSNISSTPYTQCLSSPERISLNANEKEVVFEAVSDKPELDVRLHKSNRVEKIEKIKKEREKHLKMKKDREIGMKIVSELKDVLGKRRVKILNNEN